MYIIGHQWQLRVTKRLLCMNIIPKLGNPFNVGNRISQQKKLNLEKLFTKWVHVYRIND